VEDGVGEVVSAEAVGVGAVDAGGGEVAGGLLVPPPQAVSRVTARSRKAITKEIFFMLFLQ